MEYCKHKNNFCYICGHFVAERNARMRSEDRVVWYRTCYEDEWLDETFTPSVVCSACCHQLKICFENDEKKPKYRSPMIWYNPGEHDQNSCYFCVHTEKGANTKKSKNLVYECTPYVELPVLHTGSSPVSNPELDQEDDVTAGPSHVNVDVGADAPGTIEHSFFIRFQTIPGIFVTKNYSFSICRFW